MIGPSSQISKFLLTLFVTLICFYVYMDYNLYVRIQDFPLSNEDNNNATYKDITWVTCNINPLCDITVKAVLLDHTNLYVFAPLVQIVDSILKISSIKWITPNSISFFHILVAIISAKCIISKSLAYRRVGVVLFEFRTWLDDLDGHVARVRKNIKGERSEIGTSGYYIDGLCDAIGCTALLIGIFVFLKSNPPRKGYLQLPTTNDTKDSNIVYNVKVTTKKVAKTIFCFTLQLIVSSTAWNRYIAIYQDLLERTDVTSFQAIQQRDIFKSSFFFLISLLWRIINVHNLLHMLLLSIFCDKLWEFLKAVKYIGFGILLSVICITEINLLDVKHFIYHKLGNKNRL